jgi:Flp pilus assembly protein TadG
MTSQPQSDGERGASLLEFALVAPVLLLLIFGAFEYGLFFKDYLTVSNTTRTGARVASAAGSSADADYQILQAVKAAANALPGGSNAIQQISIYKSTSVGGAPTSATSTRQATSVSP